MREANLTRQNREAHRATETYVLEDLFRSHHRRVWAYAARRVGRDEAYDVLSETFLIAFRRMGERPTDEVPWLLAIARRVCANRSRLTRRQERLCLLLRSSPMSDADDPTEG